MPERHSYYGNCSKYSADFGSQNHFRHQVLYIRDREDLERGLCIMTPCSLVGGYQQATCFGTTCRLHFMTRIQRPAIRKETTKFVLLCFSFRVPFVFQSLPF
jgi:hypothetical protein